MKIVKIERQENESLLWEIAAAVAFILNISSICYVFYLAAYNPNSRLIGFSVSLSLAALGMIFVGLKKGVMPKERVYVRI